MSRLSADILEFAALLFGDGRADVVITVDGRAQLLPVLREMADRACKLELDLACLEAVAAEIDPLMLTQAAGDAVLVESDAELDAREAEERTARRLPPGGLRALDDDDPVILALRGELSNVVLFPVARRPAYCDGGAA